MMKILHINCNYLTTVLHQIMAEHLENRGIENKIFAPTYNTKNAVINPNENVVVSECFRKADRVCFPYKQIKIRHALERRINVSEYDCIHAYTLFTDGNCARSLGHKYGIPYVTAVRSTDVNTFFKKVIYLRGRGVKILRDASAVFFMSEKYRDMVLDNYVPKGLRKEICDKSVIIPNGIDGFWLENLYTDKLIGGAERIKADLKEKRLRIIFAGNISARKNPLATQEALQILRAKGWNVSFTAVGKIVDRGIYDKMMSYPDTYYVEQQPKEKLIEYYRENDMFVMPSHTETFGLVYSEAMSQGLPVIYTKGQGFDGQFPDGQVGYAIDSHDAADIADKIVKATVNYMDLSQNALKYAHKFDWRSICEQYEEIYNKIRVRKGD